LQTLVCETARRAAPCNETLLEAVEEHVSARFGDVEDPTVFFSSDPGWATRDRICGARSLVGSRTINSSTSTGGVLHPLVTQSGQENDIETDNAQRKEHLPRVHEHRPVPVFQQ